MLFFLFAPDKQPCVLIGHALFQRENDPGVQPVARVQRRRAAQTQEPLRILYRHFQIQRRAHQQGAAHAAGSVEQLVSVCALDAQRANELCAGNAPRLQLLPEILRKRRGMMPEHICLVIAVAGGKTVQDFLRSGHNAS